MHQINADTRAVSEFYVMGVCVVALIVYLHVHVQYLYHALCLLLSRVPPRPPPGPMPIQRTHYEL